MPWIGVKSLGKGKFSRVSIKNVPTMQGLNIGSANRKFNILLFPWPRGVCGCK